jgi:hypothetical protein
LIAFASKAGSTAADGDSTNSPFTAALVKHLATPGLDLRRAFGYVRDEVLKATSNRQEPYVYGSLGGDDVPLVPVKQLMQPATNPQAEVRRDYELAERIGTREVWTAFLTQYPDGLYATLAKAHLNKLAPESAHLPPAETSAATPGVQDQPPPQKLAALSSASNSLSPSEVTTSLQFELRRVGCLNAAVTGDWDPTSQRALNLFNKHAGTKFDVKLILALKSRAVPVIKSMVTMSAKRFVRKSRSQHGKNTDQHGMPSVRKPPHPSRKRRGKSSALSRAVAHYVRAVGP